MIIIESFAQHSIDQLNPGVEHYADGVRTIKSFRDYPREFASLARRLRIEELIFVNTVEKILLDCVEADLVRELLAAPNGDSWSEPAVKRALQGRLGSSYDLYIDTIESMQKSVEAFKLRLKLDRNGKV